MRRLVKDDVEFQDIFFCSEVFEIDYDVKLICSDGNELSSPQMDLNAHEAPSLLTNLKEGYATQVKVSVVVAHKTNRLFVQNRADVASRGR